MHVQLFQYVINVNVYSAFNISNSLFIFYRYIFVLNQSLYEFSLR